jgi:hypothetical protein
MTFRDFLLPTTSGLLVTTIIMALVLEPARVPHAQADSQAASQKLTYSHDIAPLVDANCISCHHDGNITPFSLTTYESVRQRAEVIAAVTKSRYMPPWKAEIGYGDFTGVRHLSDAQIAEFDEWAGQGAPEGDTGAIPPVPSFAGGWSLRQPDAVYSMSQPYSIAADGRDVYRCFVLPTNFPTDRYLTAFEVQPGNPKVVHHVIAYLDTTGKARQLAAASGGYGYTSFGGPGFSPTGALGGWVPGNTPVPLPDGTGILLPKGADIVLQVHYHSDGKPETDLSKIGIYFTDKPVDKRVRVFPIVYPALYIPAGDSDYRVKTSQIIPADVTLLQVLPHMHLLGQKMVVNATEPDGTFVPLVKIDNWDFNWQTTYTYATPIELPAGTRIRLVADYDNSSNNPRNPNTPPKLVTWGEQTTDEMCIAFLFYTINSEHLTAGITSTAGDLTRGNQKYIAQYILSMFDENEDNALDADELAKAIVFLRHRAHNNADIATDSTASDAQAMIVAARLIKSFDANGNGKLEVDELQTMLTTLRGGN